MPWVIFLVLFLALLTEAPVWAVSQNGNFITTQPTNSDVANWTTTTGWPAENVTGWNYVGQIGASGAVYLGNGWVLTAAHVGVGNFYLNGTYYYPIATTAQYFTVPGQPTEPVDLWLFKVTSPPALSPLTISQSLPSVGNVIVMLGFGDPSGLLTWGTGAVNLTNYVPQSPNQIVVNGVTYYSTNFIVNQAAPTNSLLVDDDSGGGTFAYNTSTKKWELTGINEYYGTYSNGAKLSGFVELSSYANAINSAMQPSVDTPAMPLAGLVVMACLLVLAGGSSIRVKNARG